MSVQLQPYQAEQWAQAVPIVLLSKDDFASWLTSASSQDRLWVESMNYQCGSGEVCCLPGENGSIRQVLFGKTKDDHDRFWHIGHLVHRLPKGQAYRLDDLSVDLYEQAMLAIILGDYSFDRYLAKKETEEKNLTFVLPEGLDSREIMILRDATNLTRDLINTPAEDCGPEALEQVFHDLASEYKATCDVIDGEQVKKDYPGVYTVGRAAVQGPRVLKLTWGNPGAAKLTLIGKGVAFDTGGLDLKPAVGMRDMKKDMGGAAQVIGLAKAIMALKLDVALELWVAAVENAIDAHAYRPGDIITMRSGKSVEVGNTDAEGRLILADVLDAAQERNPDLMINFATLTGAARIALGPDLPAVFSQPAELAQSMSSAGEGVSDPLWPMPLYQPYHAFLKSDVADLCNISQTGYGGAITAALFLQNFVKKDTVWAHIDLMASNTRALPGRPKGGEAMGIRACLRYIQDTLVAG